MNTTYFSHKINNTLSITFTRKSKFNYLKEKIKLCTIFIFNLFKKKIHWFKNYHFYSHKRKTSLSVCLLSFPSTNNSQMLH